MSEAHQNEPHTSSVSGLLNWLRAAVLGANYPGSQWYEKAYKLMGKHAPGVAGK